MTTHDPFDDLASPTGPAWPRPGFARTLRAQIANELGLDNDPVPTVQLPERKQPMTTITPPSTTIATAVIPYLAVHDGAAALAWYAEALGAVERLRVVGNDGRLGHAELRIGDAALYLSDEYPEIGVVSPRTLGGTTFAVHLEVGDIDARYARAIAAGATSIAEPADQPHGARHGTLLDPFGHRWMLSQQVEQLSIEEYAARSAGSVFEVVGADLPGTTGETVTAADQPGTGGGIWAGVFYHDALRAIRFLVDTFGFEEQLVVVGPDDHTVVHSQLRWPEGGVVQVGTYDPGSEFSHAPGDQSLYVVTAEPHAVWERSQAAGLDVIRAPESPDYDPDGMSFSVRDQEGNIWSFGSYGLS